LSFSVLLFLGLDGRVGIRSGTLAAALAASVTTASALVGAALVIAAIATVVASAVATWPVWSALLLVSFLCRVLRLELGLALVAGLSWGPCLLLTTFRWSAAFELLSFALGMGSLRSPLPVASLLVCIISTLVFLSLTLWLPLWLLLLWFFLLLWLFLAVLLASAWSSRLDLIYIVRALVRSNL